MRGLIKRTAAGIGMAAAIFCVMCVISDLTEGGQFALDHYRMTKMGIGVLICGIGWGAPSIVYDKEGLSMSAKMFIHLGIGCIVNTAAALWAGWLGTNTTLGQKLFIILIQLVTALSIWLCFHLYYVWEVRKMNERIRGSKESESEQFVAVDQSLDEQMRESMNRMK